MCYRITKFVFIALAIFSLLAVFLPWQRLLLLSDEEAARWLLAKLILLPITALCLLGALWCSNRSRRLRS